MKVRIKSLGLPKAAYGQQVDYGLSLGRGMDENSTGSLKPKRTIGGVPREEANLEAEGGETVVGQISGDGIVDHMTIKGPRHSSGGVPMNLPDDSFIFSDTKSMKIKDPKILQMFGKTKGSYTPAELAKPYDISKYKAILMDPDTDRLSRNTAEIMIKNIVMKLGALALAQEAKKGFPQGIPEIAKPYMEANGITEEDLIPELKAQAEQMQAMQMQQAQAMQQQPQAPQEMPPMMPDGQPVAMPQQGMAPPEQPMMDPRQMMAMQQEQQMMPPQMEQPTPMARYGMHKFEPGGANKPCPEGMRYDIVLNDCVPILYDNKNYTEEQLEELRNRRIVPNSDTIRNIQDNFDLPLDNPMYKKMIDVNNLNIDFPEQWNEGFIGPEQPINEMRDERGNKTGLKYRRIQRSYIDRMIQQLRDSGIPEEDWEYYLRNTDQKTPPPGGGASPNQIFQDAQDTYQERLDQCPCTKKVKEGPIVKEKCVPCESQDASMAAYGMELGGYDMPFVMANGGLTKYQTAGETVEGRRAEKVDRLPGTGTRGRTDSDRFESETTITPGEERKNASEARSSGRPSSSGWEGAICDMIKDGATWEQLTDPDVAFEKTGSRKTHLNPNSPQAQEIWERCKGDQSRFEETIEDVYVEVEETEENNGCQCEKDGVVSNKMTFEEILASGRIEGYTVEQRCTGFKEAFCREEFEEEIQQKKKSDPLALPPMSSMRRRLATPDPVGLDIVPTPKTNYLDYRTAVQNQQSTQLAQINDIKNMSGLTEGQKQAMIAKVNAASTGPIASTVTDVYNKNAMLGAARYKDETALGMNQQKMRAGLDADYNRAVANTKNLETAGINQIRANRDQRAMDVYKMNVMKESLENTAENFDVLGNFIGGTPLQKQRMMACIGAGNDFAKCLAKYYPNVDPTTMGQAPTTTTTTPDPDGTPDPNATPDPDGGSSRYGGSVNSSTFIPRYSTLPYGN